MFFETGKLKEEIAQKDIKIKALQEGIQKVKILSRKELSSVRKELYAVSKKLDDSTKELKELHAKIESTVNFELETGAYNSRYFYDVAEIIISLAKRDKSHMSLAVIYINQVLIPDVIMQKIIYTISDTIRESDIFVKFEKNEFVVIFPETSLEQALIVSEKLRAKAYGIFTADNKHMSVSIGVSEFIPDSDNINTLLTRATSIAQQSPKNSVQS